MDAELVQLAREAVVALRQPNWAEVWALALSALIGFGQIGVIVWGLRQMDKASEARNRQLDQQDVALRQQGEVLAELLRRSNSA